MQIQQIVLLKYFIGVPIFHEDKIHAILFAGRQFEKVPFYQPLNKGDADTLMAIASLIDVTFQNKKMIELQTEMGRQKEENSLINRMLVELRTTQAQLIQSEKMASLGELTAGIAHEIQNPLNFVNNFSEVNSELINEMQTELEAGHHTEATAISNEIKDNQEKITLHGKRADSIVKSMLLHSRSSSGQKELTDINQLADEYLRLVYHGVRAKDKNFNATLQTDFDPSIGKINIIPQNIGRVFINLYNNAFYALSAKSAAEAFAKDEALAKTISSYQPVLVVSTKKIADKVCITVKDNGNGIPQKVVDKIFQPFFTTKPTGQGTGLGLSLSYDIVKAHGGEIKVETKEGEGSMFIIQLPEQE
jgi:two-component system, NtrC family, sensor kinase